MTDKTDSPKLIRSETTNTTLVRKTCMSCFRVLLNLLKKNPKTNDDKYFAFTSKFYTLRS